jgi:hypothetical protein
MYEHPLGEYRRSAGGRESFGDSPCERDAFADATPTRSVREFAFELSFCAALEATAPERLVARQLGASVHGKRVIDVALVSPGPEFDERTDITNGTIPPAAIEADVGVGSARYYRDAFPDRSAGWAKGTVEAATEAGFFETERRSGRLCVRQTTRYPDWFDRIVGVENKPDLGSPGDLELQLRRDVSLALFDEVWLTTASHVTGAHLNRIPAAVGVWRFDPATGERETVREATELDTEGPGVEVLEERPGRTEIRTVSAAAKARQRTRLAERAYGKGWRVPAKSFPACTQCEVAERSGVGPLPGCAWKGRLVHPEAECGPECGGYGPSDPPEVDVTGARAAGSPWVADPDGRARRQSGLDRWG